MCITSGEHGAKAACIFDAVDEKFTDDSMPWLNSVSLSVDNTNAMIGRHNSVASRCIDKNPNIFISGCPCHLAHIAATEANDAFSDAVGINVEDILIGIYYWFDKSSKRKGKLAEYFDFCDQDYQQVLKHVSTRWLSLERCIDRALKKLPSLKSYFLSENFADGRFVRLKNAFSCPILEPVLLFHSVFIQLFTHFNKLLQRSQSTIHILHSEIVTLAKKIASCIVKPQCIKDNEIFDLDLEDEDIFKPPQSIFLGGMTKRTLDKLLNEGDILDAVYLKSFTAAKGYFTESLRYILEKFPVQNELVMNAIWINTPDRIQVMWENVQYFYDRYDSLFGGIPIDKLFEEFSDYQTLSDDEIDAAAWQAAKVVEEVEDDGTEVFHYRIDVL